MDLHINIFKSLNSIVNKIRPTLLQNISNQENTSADADTDTDTDADISETQPLQGGKATRKHYKHYKNYRKTKKYKRR